MITASSFTLRNATGATTFPFLHNVDNKKVAEADLVFSVKNE